MTDTKNSNIDQLWSDVFQKQMSQRLNDCYSAIDGLDKMIKILDGLLNRMQPPISGKLRIYWSRKQNEYGILLTPYLVKWTKTKSKRWKIEPTNKRADLAVLRTNGFEHHYAQTKAVVNEVSFLLAERKELIEKLRVFQLVLIKKSQAMPAKLEKSASLVAAIADQVNALGIVSVDLEALVTGQLGGESDGDVEEDFCFYEGGEE
jgi:hypothetical protein